MRTVPCVFVFLVVAILDCQSRWHSPQPETRRQKWDSMNYYRGYGRPVSCLYRGCPNGYACRRQITAIMSPVSRCLPDIRAAIESRLGVFENGFNTGDFQALENVFTVDALILSPNLPIKRGRAGFGAFLANLKTELNWDKLSCTLDRVDVGTDDFVAGVALFQITSSVANGPTTFGKGAALWKRVRNVYEIDVFTYNFDE